MIDTEALRLKYAPRPCLFGKRSYWTPAGAKDVLALCDEVERLRKRECTCGLTDPSGVTSTRSCFGGG